MSTTAARAGHATPRGAAQNRGEKAFLALGPVAEAFLTGAAAAGVTKLASELDEILTLRRRARRPSRCSPRWSGRSRSAAGAPPTSARSCRRRRRHPAHAQPGRRSC